MLKDELREILKKLIWDIEVEEEPVDQALTAILEAVEKVIPKKTKGKPIKGTEYFNYNDEAIAYNQAIDDIRKAMKGGDKIEKPKGNIK